MLSYNSAPIGWRRPHDSGHPPTVRATGNLALPSVSTLHLTIDPADALIDAPRRIVVAGAQPGAEIMLASETMRAGNLWTAGAVYRADADGRIDLTRDAPLVGDYAGVSPMGLIWSQTCPAAQGRTLPLFPKDLFQPLTTRLYARSHEAHASAELKQRLVSDGVTREELDAEGLRGTIYRPAGSHPGPVVLILNGSGGGINEPRAALWASHGYTALALGYFNAPGLPRYISNTPLEYFDRALDWIHAHLKPLDGKVCVSGQSRGGELSLLLAALFPDRVKAVIGYVPSGFVHGGQGAADPAVGRDGPAWLRHGKPLPHIWQDNRFASWATVDDLPPPRRNSRAMLSALADPAAVRRARIPVERISGPVMLISGGDDGAWPSDTFSMLVSCSLAAAGHPHDVVWENYPAAGHTILFPYIPTTGIVHTHPVHGKRATLGGTPAANAEANETSWRAVRDWMEHSVMGNGKPAVPGTGRNPL